MKMTIEFTDDGELNIDTDDEMTAGEINAFLDVVKLHIVTGFMRGMTEGVTTPDGDGEIIDAEVIEESDDEIPV